MKYIITLTLLLTVFFANAQSAVQAVTSSKGVLTFDKLVKKPQLTVNVGDTVTLYKFVPKSNTWSVKYKGLPGFLNDSVLVQSDKMVLFKNIFINRDYKKAMIKKYGAYYGPYVATGTIIEGMTKSMFCEFMNKPDDINRTVGSWGVHEQWVYNTTISGKTEYYYFENGKLTSWQD